MQQLVVAGAEQDEVDEVRRAAKLDRDHVMRLELACGGAAGVLAVHRALAQCALLRIGGAAPDARVHEVAPLRLDREPACVAREPLGGFRADRPRALEQRRRVLAEVHDQRRRAAPHTAFHAAALPGEGDQRLSGRLLPLEHRPRLLIDRALSLGDAPDRLFEHGALLERQRAAERELAPATRPRHPQRASLVERLVVVDDRRNHRPRRECDLTRRLANRDAHQLGVRRGVRVGDGGYDLVERQRAGAHGMVERRQAAQRLTRARDPHCSAVVAAIDLREPLRTRRAPRRLPITAVVGRTYELGDPLLVARFPLGNLAQLAPAGRPLTLKRLINRPINSGEHLFVVYRLQDRKMSRSVPKVCRNAATSRRATRQSPNGSARPLSGVLSHSSPVRAL